MTSIFSEESGQGMVEYGLILALISVVVVGVLGGIGKGPINTMYNVEGKKIIEALDKNKEE